MQYNLIEMKEEHKYIMIGTIAHSAIDSKDQFLYIVTWLGEFQIFSLESKKMIGELPQILSKYQQIKLSNLNDFVILSCSSGKIYVVNT